MARSPEQGAIASGTRTAPTAETVARMRADGVLDGLVHIANEVQFFRRIRARLETYRKLFPERWAHAVVFLEDGVDDPGAVDLEAVLAKAEAARAVPTPPEIPAGADGE